MPDWGYPLLGMVPAALLIVIWLPMQLAGKAPSFERTDRLGSTALIGKRAKAMFYWAFQPIGRGLLACHVTPNGITWASGVLGLAAGAAFSQSRPGLGAFIGFLSFAADALDGLVARLGGTGSLAGEVIDAAMDRYVEFFWFIGVAFWYRQDGLRLLLTMAALVGATMVSYTSAKAEAMQATIPGGAMRRVERTVVLTLGAAFTSFAQPHADLWQRLGVPADWPLLVALLLVATLGNSSTFTRSAALMRAVMRKGSDA